MTEVNEQQAQDPLKSLSLADFVESLPEDIKQTVELTNYESSIAKFVFLKKRFCALEISYSAENDGIFEFRMTGPDLDFHSVVDHIGEGFWKKDPVAKSDFYEFVTVKKGRFDFFYGDGRESLHAGECALLNPNLFHRKEYPENCDLVELELSAEMIHHLIQLKELGKNRSDGQELSVLNVGELSSEKIALFFSPVSDRSVEPVLSALLSELADKVPGYLSIAEGYIERLFSVILDTDCYSTRISRRKVSRGEMIFQDVNLLIERSGSSISGSVIQNELGYNKDYLNRIVKTYSGMSLKEYCDYCKMQQVAALLLETDKSVNEIIEEMDFSGSSTFYRQFKKYFRTSPDEYRDRAKAKSRKS